MTAAISSRLRPSRYLLLPVLLGLLALAGCSENPTSPSAPKLELGTVVPITSKTIGGGGGTIVVDLPGDSLDGLTIEVPAGAYPEAHTYQIGYRKITGVQNTTEAFKPLTPLITISNGGGFAEKPVTLTIPCTVPDGDFPMAFLYDPATGTLEGMPLAGYDASSVTVYTANFEHSAAMAAAKMGAVQADAESGIVISSISERLLESSREVASTFKPGKDDWQFVNWGSYASPLGQCAGQTIGSLWYFMQRKSRGDAHLNGRFDNDNGIDPTPKVWQDDVSAYRFCGVLQTEYWEGPAGRIFGNLQRVLPDQLTYNAIKYAMILTGEPVYITAGGQLNGSFTRHALVAYRVVDGTVYISDPNDPGDLERTITFSGGKFTPYKFGSKGATFPGIPFPTIQYIAKSSVINYKLIKKYYDQMIDGTVGANLFPSYTIEAKNDGGYFVELTSGFRTGKRLVTLQVKSPNVLFTPAFEAYREDGTQYTLSGNDLSLPIGKHKVGIYVFDKNKAPYGYVGFNWYTIEVWETTPPHEAKTAGPCSCTLSLDGAPISVTASSFSMGGYQNPTTFQYEDDFWVQARYNGGYTTVIVHKFNKGKGTYPLFATAYDTGSHIADTNDGFGKWKTWGPYNGTNELTITDWSDWHVAGTFELTYDNDQTGEKKKAVGKFQCGR
jgi:hypothetical protein